MLKRAVMTGLIGAAGFLAFASTPAMASNDPTTMQIISLQTCRSVDVAGVGAAIHNILGISHEEGDCINGSTVNGTAVNNSHVGHKRP
ncbi:hypothetical protein GEV43_14245 [Actinomadura sp. J1-007]|nr:hypothetical protein [Actinomadura sp. J1-007]